VLREDKSRTVKRGEGRQLRESARRERARGLLQKEIIIPELVQVEVAVRAVALDAHDVEVAAEVRSVDLTARTSQERQKSASRIKQNARVRDGAISS
jgi:tetrahydrodipicolinate N-succinyltransferase